MAGTLKKTTKPTHTPTPRRPSQMPKSSTPFAPLTKGSLINQYLILDPQGDVERDIDDCTDATPGATRFICGQTCVVRAACPAPALLLHVSLLVARRFRVCQTPPGSPYSPGAARRGGQCSAYPPDGKVAFRDIVVECDGKPCKVEWEAKVEDPNCGMQAHIDTANNEISITWDTSLTSKYDNSTAAELIALNSQHGWAARLVSAQAPAAVA